MQLILGAVSGILMKMLMSVITNPKFLQDTFLAVAHKLTKATATDIDDQILAAAEQALKAGQAK